MKTRTRKTRARTTGQSYFFSANAFGVNANGNTHQISSSFDRVFSRIYSLDLLWSACVHSLYTYLYLYVWSSIIFFLSLGTCNKQARDWNIFLVKESPINTIFLFRTVDKNSVLVNRALFASQTGSFSIQR